MTSTNFFFLYGNFSATIGFVYLSFSLKGVSGIYAFIHRRSGMCYVGSSSNIGARINQHFAETRRNRSTSLIHKALNEFGIEAFDIELLEECSPSDLKQRERFYIALLGAATIDGFNIKSDPANSRLGIGDSESTKLRKSEAQKLRNLRAPISAETRLKLSITAKARNPISEETRKRMSESQKNRPPRAAFTDERKARISAALKGQTVSTEVRKKISETLKKLPPISEETRAKLSSAKKGRPVHPNSLIALRSGHSNWLNKKVSP